MATNGDVNITNLKSATGINSNDLSDHHHNGPGVECEFGYFFINGFDDTELDDRDVPSTLRVDDTFPLYMRPPSGFTQITDVNHGVESVIENQMANGPSLHVDTGSLASLQSIEYDVDVGDGNLGIKLNLKAENQGNAAIRAKWYDGGINNDRSGYNVWIYSPSISILAKKLDITQAYVPATDPAGELHVNYTFEGGNANYDVDIFRRYSTNGGSTWSSYSLQHQTTHSSTGSYEWIDTSVYSSYDYQYRVEIVGSQNDSDTATTNSMSPA